MGEENTKKSIEEAQEGSSLESEPSQVEKLETEVRELEDKYLRAIAELENYKKRAIKERSELIKYAGEPLARDIIEVVDDLERAVNLDNGEKLQDGVKLILKLMTETLSRHGVKAESGLGGKFDPNTHEALGTGKKDGVGPDMVLEEFKKAYFFKDKLLRPGQVVVSE